MSEAPGGFALKRLLVGTDFSPRADLALRRALQIVTDHGAAITLLHVCNAVTRDNVLARQFRAKLEATLHQKIQTFCLPRKDAEAVCIATGKPFLEISRQGREEAAELIVLGAHGADFIKEVLSWKCMNS